MVIIVWKKVKKVMKPNRWNRRNRNRKRNWTVGTVENRIRTETEPSEPPNLNRWNTRPEPTEPLKPDQTGPEPRNRNRNRNRTRNRNRNRNFKTGIEPLKPESDPILKVQNRSRIQTETDAMSNRIQYFVLNIYFYCWCNSVVIILN